MDALFACEITEADLLRAYRAWTKDPAAELPALEGVSASFVTAAMEEAGLAMVRVLLLER